MDHSLAHLRTVYSELDIAPLDLQQERLIAGYLRGLPLPAAARAAGMSHARAGEFLATEAAGRVLDYYRDTLQTSIEVTRDGLTVMLYDAHDLAATSGERIQAIRALGDMHGLFPGKGVNVQINNTQNNVTVQNEKQLQRLSDEELLRIAGVDGLEPAAYDAEYEIHPDDGTEAPGPT